MMFVVKVVAAVGGGRSDKDHDLDMCTRLYVRVRTPVCVYVCVRERDEVVVYLCKMSLETPEIFTPN